MTPYEHEMLALSQAMRWANDAGIARALQGKGPTCRTNIPWPKVVTVPATKECPDCDGRGEIYCDSCTHWNKCDECKGKKRVECVRRKIGDVLILSEHDDAIRTLPNVRYCQEKNKSGRTIKLAFVFDGGEGAVMVVPGGEA